MKRFMLLQSLNVNKYIHRSCSNEVRVRFAPSPTGYLHLGGLRTALYNYLFAKSHSGKFILRIEDTDQSRLVDGATKQLQDDLLWAGLEIDEGPFVGGDYGPYVQSERLHIYQESVKTLLENGSAYYCFCTDKRLDLLRREALRSRQVPKYDNKCRHISEDELQKRLHRGDKHCVRFKLLPDCETFEDMIFGNIAYDVARNEGDPVIIKADGFPTYHFANVVDDHHMKISHVLRGVEWQISATKHILMYRAFKWTPPKFGHLPLLINSDGTKLSKRQGDIQIGHYRDAGIFPLALVNFITSSGGGFAKDAGGGAKSQIYTLPQLAQKFNVDDINVHSGKLEPERLSEYNRLELERLLKIEEEEQKLVRQLQDLIRNHFMDHNERAEHSLQLDDDYLKSILKWSITRISSVKDLITKDFKFLWIKPNLSVPPTAEEVNSVTDVIAIFKSRDFVLKKDAINSKLKEISKEKAMKFSRLMKLLRKILSGLQEGPSVAEMMEILGKEATLSRLEEFVKNKH